MLQLPFLFLRLARRVAFAVAFLLTRRGFFSPRVDGCVRGWPARGLNRAKHRPRRRRRRRRGAGKGATSLRCSLASQSTPTREGHAAALSKYAPKQTRLIPSDPLELSLSAAPPPLLSSSPPPTSAPQYLELGTSPSIYVPQRKSLPSRLHARIWPNSLGCPFHADQGERGAPNPRPPT